jgi:hypothetical protein
VASPEALKAAVALLPQARAYFTPRIILVPKVDDLATQVRLALYPAPARMIRHVLPSAESRTCYLTVDPAARGKVLGPKGANLLAASALLKRQLRLDPIGLGNTPTREHEIQLVKQGGENGRTDSIDSTSTQSNSVPCLNAGTAVCP